MNDNRRGDQSEGIMGHCSIDQSYMHAYNSQNRAIIQAKTSKEKSNREFG